MTSRQGVSNHVERCPDGVANGKRQVHILIGDDKHEIKGRHPSICSSHFLNSFSSLPLLPLLQ